METKPFSAKPIESTDDRVDRARASRRGVRSGHVVRGHCIGSTRDPSSGRIHLVGSAIAQAQQGLSFDEGIAEDNVRYCKTAGRGRRNIIFVVDASGSMLSLERLASVKGCVVSLLEDAYVKRTRVALVGYGGAHARLVLPFTSSPEMAARRIDAMKGGGGTPLIEALAIAAGLIERLDGESAELVVLSDGRYNRGNEASPERRIRAFAQFCKRYDAAIHFVDASSGTKTARQRASRLASMLHADVCTLEDMRA